MHKINVSLLTVHKPYIDIHLYMTEYRVDAASYKYMRSDVLGYKKIGLSVLMTWFQARMYIRIGTAV